MTEEIKNKVVVVTGARSGLGEATARLLSAQADSFARAVAFAISQPEEVDINEILYRPTRQEL